MNGKTTLIIVLACLVIFTGGCRLPGGSEQEPPGEEVRDAPPPSIPEAIAAGEGQEPTLSVYIAERGETNQMGFEEYIMGVVAGEMDPDWPQDALAAQAIIARSFTLQKIGEDGGVPQRNAHASTDIEEFQAYNAAEINENVRNAVDATRGEVAVYENQFIRGWFHAYAGPRTALADEGLEFEEGNPPYIQIVSSPGQEIIPPEERDWEASFSLDEVRAAVTALSGEDPGAIDSVEIADQGPSGRATVLRVNDQEVSAPSLRLALGSTTMRSTFIDQLVLEGNQLRLRGTGYGHGVGMCQWGARALAEEGWNAGEIVDYFYRGIELVKLWD